MQTLKLYVNEVVDRYIRENFERLSRFVLDQAFLRGEWQFFEITFPKAVTHFKIPHNLGFQPKDILQTSLTGAGSVTFNYSLFTRDNLDVTTTGACVVRFFAGSYKDVNL